MRKPILAQLPEPQIKVTFRFQQHQMNKMLGDIITRLLVIAIIMAVWWTPTRSHFGQTFISTARAIENIMSSLRYHHRKIFPLFVLFCILGGFVVAQTNNAQSHVGVHGAEINGISARLRGGSLNDESLVSVDITIPSADVEIASGWKRAAWGGRFKYFEATNYKTSNSFWGPIELQDAAGQRVPLREPKINSEDAYPATNSVMTAHQILITQYGDGPYNGLPPLPTPLSGNGTTIPFHLKDYFKLEKSGEYKLTVWPKIYKRISPTNDICQRIDLPPATMLIQWNIGQ